MSSSLRPPADLDLVGRASLAGRELGSATVMFHEAVARQVGLSAVENKALDVLLLTGPATAGDLAERTGLTTGAITGLVDRLERAGLVRRERDEKDRRRVILRPVVNRRMTRVYERVFGGVAEAMRRELSRYTEPELELIIRVFQRLSHVLHDETVRLREMKPAGRRG